MQVGMFRLARGFSARMSRWWMCTVAMLAVAFALPAAAQGLPTYVLTSFTHAQSSTNVVEHETRSFNVPAGVGAPFYLVVAPRNLLDRNRIGSLEVVLNGVKTFGGADLFRAQALGAKVVQLNASNVIALDLAAVRGVMVDVKILGTPVPIKPTNLAPSPISIQPGATATLTATLSPVPTTAGNIAVVSSNPLVALPGSLLIPYAAGQQTISIPVKGVLTGTAVLSVGGTGGIATASVRVSNAAVAVTSLEPTTLSIEQGAGSTLTVTLNSVRKTATAVALTTQPTGVLQVPASVTVPAGALSAKFDVGSLKAGTAQVKASVGTSTATASVTVSPGAASIVSLLPPTSTVTLGATVNLTLTLSHAQTTATLIQLGSDPSGVVSVPASIEIPAGQTSISIPVGTVALGTAMVRATLNTSTAEAAVRVTPPLPTVVSIQPSQLNLVTGASGKFILSIDATQATDTVVPLVSSDAALLQVPASLTIAAGQTSAEFSVTGLAAGTARVSTTLNGVTRSAQVSIAVPPVGVALIEPSSFSMQSGATSSVTVRLNAVQAQDTIIPVTSSPVGVVQVPANVTVPAGSLSAVVPISALAEGAATVTASLSGGSASTIVKVTPPPTAITGLTPATATLPKGKTAVLRVAVSPAPSSPLVVTVTSNSLAVDVPASVTIPAGALAADIPVVGKVEGAATVSVSLAGSSAASSISVTPAEVVAIAVSPQEGTAFVGEQVQFSGTSTLTDGTTRDDTRSATWNSSQPAVGTIAPNGVAQAVSAGTTSISATSGAITASTPLTVLPTPVLTLTPSNGTLLIGASQTFTISSSAVADSGGLTVNLTASGAGAVSLPASVTIAAGQAKASFTVMGKAAGNVTLTASAPRYAPATSTLTVGTAVGIDSIDPTIGPVGASVKINGHGFESVASNNAVSIGGVAAPVTAATTSQLVVTVPSTARSGVVSVTTPKGSANGPMFTVQRDLDFDVTVSPASTVLIQGASTTLVVRPSNLGTQPYTSLISLDVSGLPAGVTAVAQPRTINVSQAGSIVLTAIGAVAPGSYKVLISATGLTSSGTQVRQGTATLTVQSSVGVTGVKGRFVDPDGNPIAGVIARVDANQTVTDAAGNFLLTNLPAGEVTLRFDATPVNPLYPIWPYNVTLTSGSISVMEDWTINPPPADDKFTPIANASADQVVTDPRFPGLEVKLPAGVSIIGWDGVPKSRIALEKRDIDKTGVSPPPAPVGAAYQMYFGTPMGGIPSKPIPMTLPNDVGGEPGDAIDVWYFDGSPMGGSGSWKIAGQAIVSPDGKVARMPDGSGVPRFCGICGLTCLGKKPQGDPPGKGCGDSAGNPVNLFNGQEQASNTGMRCGGLVPIETGMSYTAIDAFNNIAGTTGSVGYGWALDYDIAWLAFDGPQKRLVLPPNQDVNFVNDGSGNYRNTDDPRFAGAVAYAVGGGWEVKLNDGRIWHFDPFPGVTTRLRGAAPMFLTFIKQPTGATLSITRSSTGHLLAAGTQERSVTATYGANGFISEIKDPESRSTKYTYTPTNRIETVTDPEGGVTRYGYVADAALGADAACAAAIPVDNGERIKTIAYPGRVTPTENFYGPARRVIRQLAWDGRETRFDYKVVGACVTNASAPGVICAGSNCPSVDSWANYQAGWRIHGGRVVATTVTEPDGSQRTTRYGSAGQVLEQQNHSGQSAKQTFDASFRLISETDALGRQVRYQYDSNGNIVRTIDSANRIVDATYDGKWNKVSSVTHYLDDGTPVIGQFSYDPFTGNLMRAIDPLGNTTSYAYTAQGQLASVTDALGNKITYAYNPVGDLIGISNPIGNEIAIAADNIGRAVQFTDPRGFSTRIQYDGLDRIKHSTDALGGITRSTFDAAQRLTSVIDPLGHAIESYAWDSADRLTQRSDAIGNSTSYTYDAQNRVRSATDRTGRTTRLNYDVEGRISEVAWADGVSTIHRYDAVGRLIQVQDDNSTVAYSYDDLDRLVSETSANATGTHKVEYQYDALDRRIRYTVDGGDPTFYEYDAAGRLTAIVYRNQSTRYVWDAANRLIRKILPNGVVQALEYDSAGRLSAIRYQMLNGMPIESVGYTYDAADKRISRTTASDSAQEETFSAVYDAANRMSSVTLNPGGLNERRYLLTYDNNGNLVTKTNQADPADTTSFAWDARNQLVGLRSATINAAFKYDVLGRRIERTVNGSITQYVYDGAQAIRELREGAEATALLNGVQIDDVIARFSTAGAKSLLTDALGSVIAQTKDDGTVLNRYSYTPYGQVQNFGGDEGNSTQYTSREFDGTGLIFYRARYYDPELKRFVAEDPIGLGGGGNLFAYVEGDPVSLSDPEGLIADPPLTPPSFFSLTTTAALKKNTTLNQAVAAGALTRSVTMPGIMVAGSGNAIALTGSASIPIVQSVGAYCAPTAKKIGARYVFLYAINILGKSGGVAPKVPQIPSLPQAGISQTLRNLLQIKKSSQIVQPKSVSTGPP